MFKRIRYILLTILLIVATQATGQYIIDKVCVGSLRYYRVDGEPGSTYIWTLTDPFGVPTVLPSTADTVAITWSVVPGMYKLSTIQHSVITNCDGVLEVGDIEVFDQPLAFAGNPMTLCIPGAYQLLESTASNYSSLLWTTSGDGTFDNDTILHPVYTPGVADLATGSVTLTLTAQGLGFGPACTPAISSVTILQSAEIVSVTATSTNVNCFGGNNGTATAFPTGGTGIYTFLWSDPAAQTTATATGLVPGTYSVIVADENGCSDTAWTTITEPAASLQAFITSFTNVSCFGFADGTATVTASGGTVPYRYLWNTIPVQTTPTANNLDAGTYIVIVTDTNNCTASDTVTITQPPSIQVFAGMDSLICETQSPYVLFDATASNYSSLEWTTSGDGTFNNAAILNPVYTPGAADLLTGNVTLTITARGIGSCPDSTDFMILSISRQALADAGNDTTICQTSGSVLLISSTASNYTTLMWTTSGTGMFSNPSDVNPVYTPSIADITAGSVTLTITGTSASPCVTASDQMVLHITRQADAFAGHDDSICETQGTFALTLSNASFYVSLLWQTSGTGTFNDPSVLHPVYTPSAADISAGSVTLTLTAFGIVPCADSISSLVLHISRQALASAGPDEVICSNETTLSLSSASASLYTSLLWTTSGTGTFNNPAIPNPVYTISAADILSGSVILTLNADSDPPCTDVTDAMTLTIVPTLMASAGPDDTICANNPYILSGATASNYSILQWSHNGLGSLNSTAIINPTYTPAFNESGVVTFTLRAYSLSPCRDSIIDQMSLTIWPLPGGTLSGGSAICENDTALMTLTFFGTPPISVTYTNGTDTTTISGIMSSPYSIIFTPPAGTSTYTLIALNDAHCAAPPNQLLGSATYIVYPLPAVEFYWVQGSQNFEYIFNIDTAITNLGAIGNMILWNFGDGTFGYDSTEVHLFPAPYPYSVTLTVTDTNGCSNSITHIVDVPLAPNAFFDSDAPVCLGQPVCFTDLSWVYDPTTEYITTWIWNYGDGSPNDTVHFPNDPNLCHTYDTLGIYPVTLTIIDNYGYYDSYTTNITLLLNPIADFSYTEACQDMAVQFNDLSGENGGGTIVSWQWNFGDPVSGIDNFSSLPSPSHIFTTGGVTYNVTLIVTNLNNCSDTMVKQVYVRPAPAVVFTHDPACSGQQVVFTADSLIMNLDSIATWSWDFGDGTSPYPNPVTITHTFNVPGYYAVTLTVTDLHGCMNRYTDTLEVHPSPVANFFWDTPTCQGTPVQFTDQSNMPAGFTGFITKWEWNFGDGTTQTIYLPSSPNVQHLFAGSSTDYPVTLSVWSNDSCMASIQKVVHLDPAPIAGFEYSNVTCAGQTVFFTDHTLTNGGGNILTWAWNFGDPGSGTNNISDLQNPSHVYAAPGTYLVQLVVTNVNNCSDTDTVTITIGDGPVVQFAADTVCLGTPTQFTNLSPDPASILYCSWDFGDGTVPSSQMNPSHTYATYGIFNVTLTITNLNGCVNDTSLQVVVNPLPVAAFSYTAPSCLGAPVSFTDLSTTVPGYLGQIVRWIWDFGDGTQDTIYLPNNPNVTHIFNGPALSYTVRLTVQTSDSCEHTAEHILMVVPSPVANFSSVAFSCEGQLVLFTDLSDHNGGGNITQWSWDFGDPPSGANNQSNIQHPQHAFSGPGTYQVMLIVSNANNCSDTVIKPIVIGAGPAASFSADTSCLGAPTAFTDLSVPGSGIIVQHLWNFGDGQTSIQANPTHTYATCGDFTVTLTVTTSTGCVGDTTGLVRVLCSPSALFAISSPVCAGDSVHFTNYSTTPQGYIDQWIWNFGDGTSLTIDFPGNPNVSHLYANAGFYMASLTVRTSDGCVNMKQNQVQVMASPLAGFQWTSNACELSPVQFTDLSAPNGGGTIVQYLWNFGDPGSGGNNTSTLKNPLHSFTHSGTFTVTLSVTNLNGCSDSVVHDVLVGESPVAAFSADTACTGEQTQFTDLSTTNNGTVVAWMWNFGDPASGSGNTSTLQNPTHIFASPGTYAVTLTVTSSGFCTDDTVMMVSVVPEPQAMFSAATSCVMDSTQFTDLSVAPNSQITGWLWDFGDGSLPSTMQNPVHAYQNPGTFQVTLTVTNLNNCTDAITLPVVIHPAPVAAFTYNSLFCPTGQVQFQDQSSGQGAAITEWMWIFEPGSISNQPNPVHIFPVTDTVYAVTLMVENSFGCRDTIVDSIYVSPGFAFTFTFDTVCYTAPTHFAAQNLAAGDSLYFLTWEFGDPGSGSNNISHDYDPTHTFTHAGNFTVKLKAWDRDNCVDSVYREVNINGLPVPQFTSSFVPCDSVVHFTDQSLSGGGSIARWEWSFGDGTLPLVIMAPGPGDVSHVYAGPGSYTVSLTVTNSLGCSETVTSVVQPSSCLTAAFIQQGPQACANGPVTFFDQSVPAALISNWHWLWGDNKDTTYSVFAPSVQHVYAGPGVYTVRLIITTVINLIEFTDTATATVTIHTAPDALFVNNSVCLNQPTMFEDRSETFGEQILSWSWNFGDPVSGQSNNSALQDPAHQYSIAGLYDVQLVVMNKLGCSDSVVKPVQIFGNPKADFTTSPVCAGNPTYFFDQSLLADTLISMWRWNFGDPNGSDHSILKDPVHNYYEAGNYVVALQVKDYNGCADTMDSIIKVNPSPLSAFHVIENYNGKPGLILLNNQSQGADYFLWDFGNGRTSEEENPVVTYTEDGVYVITLITENEFQCTDTTIYEFDLLFKGLFVPNAFSPLNPNIGVRLFKPIGINLKEYHIQIFHSWGERIWESSLLDSDGRPMEGWNGMYNNELLPSGTYLWRIDAVFRDGTIWPGSSVGGDQPSIYGTITLVR